MVVLRHILVLIVVVLGPALGIHDRPAAVVLAQAKQAQAGVAAPNQDLRIFLPAIYGKALSASPFGFEVSSGALQNKAAFASAEALHAGWVRLNIISWREVQPDATSPYNWQAKSLQMFERELAIANTLELIPLVIVDDSPRWATETDTACGAIRRDAFGAFARFMVALVERYQSHPYNVHYWELGNEPDIDPSLVPQDHLFGCWGKISDPYYGGEHYGEMLKVVTPAIKAADASAKVMIGGLLLNSPNTTTPGHGKPERFLEGILRALSPDAYAFFDIVPYHLYATWAAPNKDYSGTDGFADWNSYGGIAPGKPQFLRDVMQKYGVAKPLFLNETSLTCWVAKPSCGPLAPLDTTDMQEYYDGQAQFALRVSVRSLYAGVESIIWYTLNGPGWRNSGLLDAARQTRPAYSVYQKLIKETRGMALPPSSVDEYGLELEAYRFNNDHQFVDVIWSRDAATHSILIPESKFVIAYTPTGQAIPESSLRRSNGNVQLSVGLNGMYIQRLP